jgi:hypothetical protein
MPARGKSESLNSINKLCMVVHACDPSFCVRLLVEESLSEAGPGGGGPQTNILHKTLPEDSEMAARGRKQKTCFLK